MEEDLLKKFLEETGGDGDFLEAIQPKRILLGRLTEIKQRVNAEGSFLVISHYGTLANAVGADPLPPSEIIHEAVQIIHKGLVKTQQDASVNGTEWEKFTPPELTTLRRTLAIMVFLAHRALSGMERKSVEEIRMSTGSKTTGRAAQSRADVNWRNLRGMIIEDILGILELPIEHIWEDSGYGFSLSRVLICTMRSHFIEPELAKENLKAGNDAYKILAILAKRFKKSVEVYERIFPLMKYGEDVAKIVSSTIDIMANEYEIEDATRHALQVALDLSVELEDKGQTVMEKGIAVVVLDLCETTAKQIIQQCGRLLLQLLNNVNSATIRSATVQGATHLMRWLRDHQGEAVSNRKLRRMILDEILLSHCLDVNSLVRAKCLTILVKLIDEKMIDPVEVSSCLIVATDRIVDQAVLSRKYALTVVNTVLSKFPGICNQNLSFKEEIDKLRQNLLQIMIRKSPRKSEMVYCLVREFAEQVQIQEIPLPEAYAAAIEAGMVQVKPLIARLVKDEKFWDACIVLYQAFQIYGTAAGIRDAGKTMVDPKVFISYFNSTTNGGDDSGDESQRSLLETSLDISKSISQESENNQHFENEEVTSARELLLFSQGCLKMKLHLEVLVDKLTFLLQVGTDNDRTEVIRTVGELVRCGYPVNEKVSGPIIQAIASLGNDSAAALIPAFWSIFIGDKQIGHFEMIRNIFKILDSVDAATKDLLKPIIGEMYVTEAFSKPAIMGLWDAFTKRYGGNWSDQDAKNAIFVLGAIGRRDKGVLMSNIRLVIETGLGQEAVEHDLELVKYTMEAVLYSFKVTKKHESDVNTTQRFPATHDLFKRIHKILLYGVTKKGDWDTHQHFPRVAELSVQIFYRLNWDHTEVMNSVLQSINQVVFQNENDGPPLSELQNTEEIYIRYLAFMTALLGTHINFCETVIIPEIKRRKQIQMDATSSTTSKTTSVIGTPSFSTSRNNSRSALGPQNASMSSESSRSSRGRGSRGRQPRGGRASTASTASTASNNALAEMEAIIGNAGFDAELEMVKTYVEKLLDEGTFQQFRRLTLYFCQKITNIQHYKLQVGVVNAMAKLMLVSPDSVNKLVDAFINLWTVVNDPRVKVEVLKHLTALNVRFPNQVERCNVIIKAALKSEDEHIKTAALDFMGYLALGDMVKIRDSIAEVALCLCSDKRVIRELAVDFFDVCADKENFISNAVPEVISQLSNREGLSQDEFQSIMKFLLARVKREKQVLGLVETLIGRLRGPSENERLWEDTTYCLSNLAHGEKTFKIIRDNLPNYTDKLKNDTVYRSFLIIVEALRKTLVKPDLKAKLEDYERDLEDNREKCTEKDRIAGVKNREQTKRNQNAADKSSDADQSSLMEGTKDKSRLQRGKEKSKKKGRIVKAEPQSDNEEESQSEEEEAEGQSDKENRKSDKENSKNGTSDEEEQVTKKEPKSTDESDSDNEAEENAIVSDDDAESATKVVKREDSNSTETEDGSDVALNSDDD